MCPREFKKMVVLGESTVEGGEWVLEERFRFVDVLADLINQCQENPMVCINKGIGANAISPRSPGYAESAKPSALERYREDVIENNPDLFVLCYGLNDMRARMDVEEFREDMQTILADVRTACDPVIVLTTVYYMTGFLSWPPYDKGSVHVTEVYNEVIRQLAEDNGCILADVWASEGEADWLIHPDGVHANRVGNLLIANRVFEALAKSCSGLSAATFEKDAKTERMRFASRERESVGDPFVKTW